LNAGLDQVSRLDTHERSATVQHPGARLAADGGGDGQNEMETHTQHEAHEHQARSETFDPERDVAGLAPSHPGLVSTRGFQRNLSTRIAHTDDERGAVLQLREVTVVEGVELHDPWIKIAGERRR